MDNSKRTNISKTLSYILRHKPEKFNITLDKEGYTLVDSILSNLNITIDELEHVVSSCDKQRFKFNEDKTKIKANQGHSIDVDLNLKAIVPPVKLYHGTAPRFYSSIMKEGLKKMNRHHVHLYDEESIKKAKDTGSRHQKGLPGLVLEIDAKEMLKDGFKFFRTDNNVYLCDYIPSKYITIYKS